MILSIVVPTLGRSTLAATLASIRDQATSDDEVIVVADADGDHVRTEQLFDEYATDAWTFEEWPGDGSWDLGYSQRNHGVELATGTHLAFMDDDDVYAPGALELMRTAACAQPVIFRMLYLCDRVYARHGDVLWRNRDLRYANVATPMILTPNTPGLPSWAPWPGSYNGLCGGDFTFIKGCCDLLGPPVWREEVIAHIRPHEAG